MAATIPPRHRPRRQQHVRGLTRLAARATRPQQAAATQQPHLALARVTPRRQRLAAARTADPAGSQPGLEYIRVDHHRRRHSATLCHARPTASHPGRQPGRGRSCWGQLPDAATPCGPPSPASLGSCRTSVTRNPFRMPNSSDARRGRWIGRRLDQLGRVDGLAVRSKCRLRTLRRSRGGFCASYLSKSLCDEKATSITPTARPS